MRFKEDNFDGYDIKKISDDNIITYKANSLPAIEREELAPSLLNRIPKIQVASNHFSVNGIEGNASNWNELGQWMYDKILADRTNLSGASVQNVKQLVAGIEDPLIKAQKVYLAGDPQFKKALELLPQAKSLYDDTSKVMVKINYPTLRSENPIWIGFYWLFYYQVLAFRT